MTKNPERIHHVSKTQLSIARYFGGCKYNGDEYVYIPGEDVLIRKDVFKKEKKGKNHNDQTSQMKFPDFK